MGTGALEKKTTSQLIKEIEEKEKRKKQEQTNLIKERLYKTKKIFKPKKQNPKNITEDNLKAIEELFSGIEKNPELPKRNLQKTEEQRTKEELDRILDKMDKNKKRNPNS